MKLAAVKSTILALLLLFGLPAVAVAQTPCDTPAVTVMVNGKLIKALPHPLPASLVVVLTVSAECPPGEFGQFAASTVEVALVRGKRPVKGAPISAVKSDKIDLSEWAKWARPGDRLMLEVREYDVTTPTGPAPRKAQSLLVALPVQ